MIDVTNMIAQVDRQKRRKSDAERQIDESIKRCDQPNEEYKKRCAKPIAYTREMVEAEVERALRSLGRVQIGYGDEDFSSIWGQRPRFRIDGGEVYMFGRYKKEMASEVVRKHGADILPYIKDKNLREAFEKYLAYIKTKDRLFDCKSKSYCGNVEEPRLIIPRRTVWRTEADGYAPIKDVMFIRFYQDGNDDEPDPFVEVLDAEGLELDTIRMTEFTVSQLQMEIDQLIGKREEMAKKNLRFIRDLRDETDALLGPWIALRNL